VRAEARRGGEDVRDGIVGVIELWAGVYLAGVGIGLLEMTWYAWRTRNVELDGGGPWFWRQYVVVILGWPVLVGWVARAAVRDWWGRRRR
jgi:hypothetical protein